MKMKHFIAKLRKQLTDCPRCHKHFVVSEGARQVTIGAVHYRIVCKECAEVK